MRKVKITAVRSGDHGWEKIFEKLPESVTHPSVKLHFCEPGPRDDKNLIAVRVLGFEESEMFAIRDALKKSCTLLVQSHIVTVDFM